MSFLGNVYPYFNFPYHMRTMPVTIGHQNYHLPLVWVLNQEQRITEQQFRQMVKNSVSGYINFVISEGGKQVKDMSPQEKTDLNQKITDNIRVVLTKVTQELLKNKNIVTATENKYHQGASDLNRELNELIKNSIYN